MNDENGRILILEVRTDDTKYLMVNIYSANTEQDQLKTHQIFILIENFDNFYNKNMILASDLIYFSMKAWM